MRWHRSLLVVLACVCVPRALRAEDARAEGAPRAALLLVAQSDGEHTTLNFGLDPVTGTELERWVRAPFDESGIALLTSEGQSPMVGPSAKGLAIGDQAALDLAQKAGASIAVNVGLVGRSGGPIRGTNMVGRNVEFRIRVLEVATAKVVYERTKSLSGYGAHAAEAQSRAASSVVAKSVEGLASSLALHFPSEAASAGTTTMTIGIAGAKGWREVSAVLKRLAGTKGIEEMHLVRLSGSEVRLQVSSKLSAASLVSALRRARIPNGTLRVHNTGNSISIQLDITSTAQPIING